MEREIKRLFEHFGLLAWECNVKCDIIEKIALEKFLEISKQCSCNKKMIRLVGQSGSGKTTQLLPTAQEKFKQIKQKPLHLCVREFARLHPQYEEIVKEAGKEKAREKTNGFALRVLICCLYWAIESKTDILLEMTFLTTFFEKILLRWLKTSNYSVTLLCIAVNINISNSFIQKRLTNKNSQESGRVVFKESIVFFDKQLMQGLRFCRRSHLKQRIIIWNAFDKDCKFDGELQMCLPTFLRERKKVCLPLANERELLKAKMHYFCHKVGS